METTKLTVGTRAISPDGEGEIIDIHGGRVTIRLDDGVVKTYSPAEVSDDSDAG